MITASHLPFNRNGFKFFDADGGLEKADITRILEIAAERDALVSDEEINSTVVKNPALVCEFDLISLYSANLCMKSAMRTGRRA